MHSVKAIRTVSSTRQIIALHSIGNYYLRAVGEPAACVRTFDMSFLLKLCYNNCIRKET